MQFWKNSRSFNIFFICMLFSACTIDKIPETIRESKELAKTQYYGFRADKWQKIEDSYLAGQANCCGPDKRNSDVRALNFYCEAALLDHKASQIEVGRLYMHEAGAGPKTAVPFDRTLAHAYYTLAAQGGYEFAAAIASELGKKLTPDELARSNQLVTDYPNIPCNITE